MQRVNDNEEVWVIKDGKKRRVAMPLAVDLEKGEIVFKVPKPSLPLDLSVKNIDLFDSVPEEEDEPFLIKTEVVDKIILGEIK